MFRKSYIISSCKVSKTTYDFVHGYLRGFDVQERRFFLHLLCSHLSDLRKKKCEILPGYDVLGLSLPSKTIRAEFPRGFSWKRLRAEKLIEVSPCTRSVCMYYQIAPTIFDAILTHLEQQTLTPDGSPSVNLFDGTAHSVGWAFAKDESLPSSKLMRDAVRVLHASECPFNVVAIQRHLDQLRLTGKPNAFANDRLCAQTLFAGMKRKGDLGFYFPSYSPQSSGRISENGGGLQSCSRAMKKAAFSGIDFFNYDLRSSQGYAFLQDLRLAGIEDKWLVDHLGSGAFEQRAQNLNLPKKVYKKCFFATIMGATHRWLEKAEHVGRLQKALRKHYGTEKEARQKFDELVVQLKPLKKVVRLWTKWLIDDPACKHRKKTQRREYLENAAGQKLQLDRSTSATKLKRKAAAHMLQGQEAAYIHHLTILSKDYGFVPISNQHDGLVTLGTIPQEAQAKAAELSGFRESYLELKLFV
jgi:hypothetical protein